jgi:hypothetical protein
MAQVGGEGCNVGLPAVHLRAYRRERNLQCNKVAQVLWLPARLAHQLRQPRFHRDSHLCARWCKGA